MTTDSDLHRFVEAQEPVYDQVLSELAAGRKSTHWMWFVFPLLEGLGRSSMAIRYGIASADEAQAYWPHPVLGQRLKECVDLVLAVKGRSAFQIFGSPDDLKLRSSMTLFAHAVPDEHLFTLALVKYFAGRHDPRTMELLGQEVIGGIFAGHDGGTLV